jgi:hypothetical protein
MPSLGAILTLRDKNPDMTLTTIIGLPQAQYNIIKQLANAYDRTLSR